MRAQQVTVPFDSNPNLLTLLGIPERQRGSYNLKLQAASTNTQDITWGDAAQQPMTLTSDVLPGIRLKDLYVSTVISDQLLNVIIWQ